MNLVAKALRIVADLASESTSTFGFYEPKMPKKLVKRKKKTERKRSNR